MAEADGANVESIALAQAMRSGAVLAKARHRGLPIELRHHGQDLWVAIGRGKDGGIAIRLPLLAEASAVELSEPSGDGLIELVARNEVGRFRAVLGHGDGALEYLRWSAWLTPARDLHIPYLPRDLVAFGPRGDSLACSGTVEARQRRLNTGLVYVRFAQPDLGKMLYVQDFGALDAWFQATGTKPEGVVGGAWPVLGYLPPTKPDDPRSCLPAGTEIPLQASHLVFRAKPEEEERESAWQFLDMLGTIYPNLVRPSTVRRDWVGRSRRTIKDLASGDRLRSRHFGHTYFHPYTDAEHPDSMVQLAILVGLRDWSAWSGEEIALERQIASGMERFYDSKLKTLRRYLPDVGDDKNPDAVDSWYLYHPLLSLGSLALAGEDWARDLFLRSVEYGVRAARHFQYRWPIMYDITDFSVITPVAEVDQLGQTDVGGIYAFVMLQAFQLTDDGHYLKEAKAALTAARGMRFDLNYQANLTAWGATACMKLWRITDEKAWLGQSYVYLASFFHNCQVWESRLGWARHYSNFMAATCLQDAPYMAMYECYDSYAAFERYLDLAGPDLIDSVRLLLTEYCRHALHRAWWYYPDALPPEALAEKPRNGVIDRALSLPVEDLYPDGQQAGQVGQEVYGAASAMVFATRSYHRIEGAPFAVFCDHFLRAFTRVDNRTITFALDGEADAIAELAIVKTGRARLPEVVLRNRSRERLEPARSAAGELCWEVPGDSALVLSW